MRDYLWSYDTLEQLAKVEVEIYSAFINRSLLKQYFDKLLRMINETLKEDEDFNKEATKLADLVNDVDTDSYHLLVRVNETNPDKAKSLKLEDPKSKNDEEEI